jgi:hypothetical protein
MFLPPELKFLVFSYLFCDGKCLSMTSDNHPKALYVLKEMPSISFFGATVLKPIAEYNIIQNLQYCAQYVYTTSSCRVMLSKDFNLMANLEANFQCQGLITYLAKELEMTFQLWETSTREAKSRCILPSSLFSFDQKCIEITVSPTKFTDLLPTSVWQKPLCETWSLDEFKRILRKIETLPQH